jgi:hypothetical protein
MHSNYETTSVADDDQDGLERLLADGWRVFAYAGYGCRLDRVILRRPTRHEASRVSRIW